MMPLFGWLFTLAFLIALVFAAGLGFRYPEARFSLFGLNLPLWGWLLAAYLWGLFSGALWFFYAEAKWRLRLRQEKKKAKKAPEPEEAEPENLPVIPDREM